MMRKTTMNLIMRTAWHRQQDGQIEKIISFLNMYMRSFCEGDELSSPMLLPIAKLSYNTIQTVPQGNRPFFMCYTQEATQATQVCSDWSEWYRDQERLSGYFSNNALCYVEQRNVILRNAKLESAMSQDCYVNVVNKHQRDEKVWLDSRNLGLPMELSAKWSASWIELFPVEKTIPQNVYVLDINKRFGTNWHPVFFVSKLKKYNKDETNLQFWQEDPRPPPKYEL